MAMPGDDVRVVGEAFLVKGNVAEVALDGRVVREVAAPHMLETGAFTVVSNSAVRTF